MLPRKRWPVLDDDPQLFETPPEWLLWDSHSWPHDRAEGEIGLFSLIEHPESLSPSWWKRERRSRAARRKRSFSQRTAV